MSESEEMDGKIKKINLLANRWATCVGAKYWCLP